MSSLIATAGRARRLARVALAALRLRRRSGMGEAETKQADGRDTPSAAEAGLISPEYQEQNAEMHRTRNSYGVMAQYHLPEVRLLTRVISSDVLDYGCGKRLLERGLGFPISNYDPGIPGLDATPRPADVVACLDVLEHIEPDHLHAVLSDLARVTRRAGYFAIATEPAGKTLPDGRNAHLIVEPPEWWERTLERYFEPQLRFDEADHVTFLVGPRNTH